MAAPLALPAVGIGALLAAISTMKELPATPLLRPTGVSTLATELWSCTTALELGAAVPAVILSGIRGLAKESA